jgi:hypothetical protein
MKKLFVLMCLMLAFSLVSFAADSVTGTLMDTSCAKKHMGENLSKADTHPKACALQCGAKSGFAVVTSDGKILALDEAGNKKAMDYLHNSKSDSMKVKVNGTLSGEKLSVDSIEPGA